jgi:hypothetical protein
VRFAVVDVEPRTSHFSVRLCCAVCGVESRRYSVQHSKPLCDMLADAVARAVVDEGWTMHGCGSEHGRCFCAECRPSRLIDIL